MNASRCCVAVLAVAMVPFVALGQEPVPEGDPVPGDEFIDSTGPVLDGPFNLEDVILRIQEFGDEAPRENGDVNGDAVIDVSDPIYLLNLIFRRGPAPLPLSCATLPPPVGDPEPFLDISLELEFNETDGDADVTITAASSDGIRSMTIHDPGNRPIVRLQATEGDELLLEEVVLEGSDPGLDGIKSDYPEGEYLFQAVTTSGRYIAGLVELTHDLLPAPLFDHTLADEGLVVQWPRIDGASHYVLEIEQDELGFNLTMELEPDVETFTVPRGLLVTDHEYDLSMGTVTEDDNIAVAEETFTIPSSSGTTAAPDE